MDLREKLRRVLRTPAATPTPSASGDTAPAPGDPSNTPAPGGPANAPASATAPDGATADTPSPNAAALAALRAALRELESRKLGPGPRSTGPASAATPALRTAPSLTRASAASAREPAAAADSTTRRPPGDRSPASAVDAPAVAATHLAPPPPRLAPGEPATLEALVGGELVRTAHGRFLVARRRYAPDHTHGAVALGALRDEDPRALVDAALDAPADPASLASFDDALFLDTETTGLSGGTGTYPFLVGLARVSAAGVEVEQLFVREMDEEPAMLAYLAEAAARARFLVTFNGKCFDATLLATRYALHRQPDPLARLWHLDLLHVGRRLWKRRVGECNLGALEREVLALRRQEDVPGHLVPYLYFQYLRTGDAGPLGGVFHHNLIDVVSMVALTAVVLRNLRAPEAWVQLADDRLAQARLLERAGRAEEALALAERVLTAQPTGPRAAAQQADALALAAALHRRAGRHAAAAEAWRRRAEADPHDSLAALELAKLLEHKLRDLEAALRWAHEAHQRMPGPGAARRVSRLERRVEARRAREARREPSSRA